MKLIKKISIFLIAFAIILPNIGQIAVGDIKIDDYTLINIVPGTYIIWNVTEAENAYLYTDYYYDHNTIMVGDQFKLTITGISFIREEIRHYFDEYSYYSSYIVGENPCVIGTFEYYNKTTDHWKSVQQNHIAVLMYNITTGRLYSAADIVEKYFLIAFPQNFNLSDFGKGIVNQYYDWDNNPSVYFYNKFNISDYSSTADTLNLTLESNSGPPIEGYNYIKLRNDGIVSKWNYYYDTTNITAEYLNSGIIGTGQSIPFGSEYIIFIGISIIAIVIIVRKHINIKTDTN